MQKQILVMRFSFYLKTVNKFKKLKKTVDKKKQT